MCLDEMDLQNARKEIYLGVTKEGIFPHFTGKKKRGEPRMSLKKIKIFAEVQPICFIVIFQLKRKKSHYVNISFGKETKGVD